MATATSRIVSNRRTSEVRMETTGIRETSAKAAVAVSCMSRWPAVRLAVSRTPRARGRINRLIVSIIIRIGIRGTGVPSGRRWPKAAVGWFRIPMRTVANHKGTANPMFIESWVVGVKVYGRRPSIFKETKKTIKEESKSAHLCPATFKGINIW